MEIGAQVTAIEAYEKIRTDSKGEVARFSSAFICPFPDCKAYAVHEWGTLHFVTRETPNLQVQGRPLLGASIYAAKCALCNQEVLFVDDKMVKPAIGAAPVPAGDMPAEILGEYAEAAEILTASPRGSAALLRLAVQKLLPLLGATKSDINSAIGELVEKGTISARVQTSLDALRVIGNEAVHPGTIDLNDNNDIAMGLFRLLNFIIEKAVSDPKHAEEMFALLPQKKREAIARRDGVPPAS